MLYVTTREKHDAHTAPWTLRSDTGSDGGLYLPFKMPVIDTAQLKEKSFGQTVADVLNLFFSTGMTGWDVEFSVGRYPVKLASAGQKVTVAELWRNLDGSYEKLEKNLAARICGCSAMDVTVTSWLRIAVRIAVLTAVFGELQRQDVTENVDISVPAGDCNLAMAVWYGRKMGLPIANIIFCCKDNDPLWDLLHVGEMRTSAAPASELERLIHATLGVDEVHRFVGICGRGGVYALAPHMARSLKEGIFAAVVSDERTGGAIPNIYGTSGYIAGSETAMAYSGLMDYRAKTGERRIALLLADSNPGDSAEEVAAAMKISADKLKELLK